jgi:hypothetical protein
MYDITRNGTLLIGEGRELKRISDDSFVNALKHLSQRIAERLAFMTREHHMVRDFVVREIPRESRALSARRISSVTGLDDRRVAAILAELERYSSRT